MIYSAHFRTLSLITVMVGLSACTSFLPDPKPADTVYRLPVAGYAIAPANLETAIVRMDRPIVPSALKGDDIIVVTDGQTISSVAGAVWAESIPALIQRAFVDTLASRSAVTGVLPNSGARPEYRISFNVRQFEAEFDAGTDNAPLAVVNYSVTLSNAGSRKLIGVFDVRETHRAASNRVPDIVQAQSQANKAANDSIADWLEQILVHGS